MGDVIESLIREEMERVRESRRKHLHTVMEIVPLGQGTGTYQ